MFEGLQSAVTLYVQGVVVTGKNLYKNRKRTVVNTDGANQKVVAQTRIQDRTDGKRGYHLQALSQQKS